MPDVIPHPISYRLAILAGVIWLGLALPPLLLAAFAVLLGSLSAILFVTMGVASLAVATALLRKPDARPPILASVVLGGLVAAIAVLASLRSSGAFPSTGPIVVYGALAACVALMSTIAASRVVRN